MLLTQTTVAIGMPLLFTVGHYLFATGWLPEIVIGSILVSFFLGIYSYWKNESLRRQPIGHLRVDEPMYKISGSFWANLLAPMIFWPLALAATGVFSVWSEKHFVAIAIPAFACAYLSVAYGAMPVAFLKEYFLAFPEIPPSERYYGDRGEVRPNDRLLFVVLGVLLFLPIVTSATVTYLLLPLILVVTVLLKLHALNRPDWIRLLRYLVLRSHAFIQIYLDYHDTAEDAVRGHWIPPSTRKSRRLQFKALFAAVCALLLTSLSYYCPWEFFAWGFVPESRLAETSVSLGEGKFAWLFAPFAVARFADPLAGYMLTYLFALLGYIVFPPLFLFTLYFDRIVEVEAIHQRILLGRRLLSDSSP